MKKLTLILALLFCCINKINAQNIEIENLKGEKEVFSDIIKGNNPVIVTFWATWCKPCLNELEALKDLKPEWNGKARIIAVSIDDSRTKGKVNAFAKGKNYPFEIYIDPNKDLYKNLNVLSVPFVFIFKKGEKTYMHSGYNPGDETYLLEKALK